MKKLCFVCFNIEDMGGITRVTSALTCELCKKNEVHIVSVCSSGKDAHYFFEPKIKIHKFGNNPKSRLRNIIFESFKDLKKYFKDNNFDIIFMQGHYIPPIILPLRPFIKSKIVFCDHGALENQINDKKATFFRKMAAKFCDKVIVLTREASKEYKKIFKISEKKISVIANFIDDEIFKYKNDYNTDSKIIISSGRFTKEKGFDTVPEIAEKIFEKHPDWQWHIYGDGPEFNRVKNKLAEKNLQSNVILMELADNMYKEYSNRALFVLTSYREGFSLVLLEAKAAGLPLVSFDCPCGPGEIINDGVDGYLIPCYDKNDMSEKICKLIENPELRRKFSENSEDDFRKFSKTSILAKWDKLIKDL